MPAVPRKHELARADRVLPGVWRLRLPLPWPGVPHVNAWALSAGDGVVLVDTGLHEPGSMSQLELALGQAGLSLDHVRLLVCTHAHSDHYGQAAPIVDAAGCELWLHPDHDHLTRAAEHPERMLERRVEVALQSGVPKDAVKRYQEARKGQGMGVARVVEPDRDLVDGVEFETDHGIWRTYETPGHAPSHVVLHQADRGLLISGDHLLGRVSLYYDYGWTPDPAGEFLSSLDRVEELECELCLAGHGRPFREVRGKVQQFRREVQERMERVRAGLRDGPRSAFDLVPGLLQIEELTPMLVNWGLSEALCYLRHLEVLGEVERLDGEPERWELA